MTIDWRILAALYLAVLLNKMCIGGVVGVEHLPEGGVGHGRQREGRA